MKPIFKEPLPVQPTGLKGQRLLLIAGIWFIALSIALMMFSLFTTITSAVYIASYDSIHVARFFFVILSAFYIPAGIVAIGCRRNPNRARLHLQFSTLIMTVFILFALTSVFLFAIFNAMSVPHPDPWMGFYVPPATMQLIFLTGLTTVTLIFIPALLYILGARKFANSI